MNTSELEKIIIKLRTIKNHIDLCEKDPLLVEDYEACLLDLKMKYGQVLNDMLFDIYDEYCEDDEIKPIMDYLSDQGVEVQAYDLPNSKAYVRLKTSPPRFEFESTDHTYKQVYGLDQGLLTRVAS